MRADGPAVHADWLVPEWRAEGVGALMTTRRGGTSAPPFDTMNLRDGVGDDPLAVARNTALLSRTVGAALLRLDQVHGARVVRVTEADARPGARVHTADACVTSEAGVALCVQTADCLPVLFAAPGGRAVGAAHAGWRGLAAGVLGATLAAVCDAAACAPRDVDVWLGACIGASAYEVGSDVLDAFSGAPGVPSGAAAAGFVPRLAPGKWLCDLPGLARVALEAAGARRIGGGTWCTASDPSRFFSFRRDGVTGRMAAVVWIGRGGSARV